MRIVKEKMTDIREECTYFSTHNISIGVKDRVSVKLIVECEDAAPMYIKGKTKKDQKYYEKNKTKLDEILDEYDFGKYI